jgi:hypothetical protein
VIQEEAKEVKTKKKRQRRIYATGGSERRTQRFYVESSIYIKLTESVT